MARDFINNVIRDVIFGLSQGYSASSQYRGSQARSAGIGAALGAAPLRQQLLLKQQQDEEDRRLRMEQIRAQIEQSGNAQALQAFNAMNGKVQAPEVPLDVPRGMSVDPRAQGQVFQGDTQMAPSQLPAMNVGGQMLRPQSAQDVQRMALELSRQNRQPMPDQTPFASSPSGIFDTRTGRVSTPAPDKIPVAPNTPFELWLQRNPNTSLSEWFKLDDKQTSADEGAVELSPAAMDKMAEMFAMTGNIPPLGLGKEATHRRSQIINRAAQMFPNVDFATNKAAYQANSQSLNALQKSRDAVVAFESTATKNLDIFLEKAAKVVDSGSPTLNVPLRAIARSGLGSAEQAAYDAARQVAVNEIAKVVSNPNLTGQLSDSARKEVSAFSPENATLKQVYAVANVLKRDMANRKDSLDQQISAIRDRIKNGGGTEVIELIRGADGKLRPK